MQVEGQLKGAKSGYSGHSVEAVLTVSRALTDAKATALELLAARAEVQDNGRFTLTWDDALSPVGRSEVIVRAPNGVRLTIVDVALANGQPLTINAVPQPPVAISVDADPYAASLGPVSVTVQIVDRNAPERVANQLVSLWGEPKAPRGSNADGNPTRSVLGAGYTDIRGRVSISVTRQPYVDFAALVPAAGATPFSVELDDKGLPPAQVSMTVSLPDPGAPPKTDCDCDASLDTPRTPQHSDLVGSIGVFSKDLGNGVCPTPALPNRTIEEHRYYSLVRTTDPVLLRGDSRTPSALSDQALQIAGQLAYGFGTMDALLQPRASTAGVRSDLRADGATSLDGMRAGSAAYLSSGLINARAWRDTVNANDVQKAIVARASSLSESTLRAALADPDGFTPATLMTAERAGAFDTIARTLDTSLGASLGRRPISKDNLPRWDGLARTYQAATIAHGHVLEWRQVWRADGYSLGDLLYSLPLAPGQKRKLVVLDWDRRETAQRSEERSFSESFAADLSRDRAISEIVNSTITESIRAGSSTNTWGAGGGIGLGIPFSGGFFGLGVAGGAGGSSSTAWQDSARALSAYAGQQLSDRTQQASAAVRSQRASVVIGQQQSESVSVTSEVVANYNHCHALTIEYFEVLEHYRVDQELAAVSECLFVPLIMTRFDDLKVLRWRDELQPYLRNPALAPGFDAIDRIVGGYADSGLPPGRYADEIVRELTGELRFELDIRRPRPPNEGEDINAYLNSAWSFWIDLFGIDAARAAYDGSVTDRALADRIFADQLAPRVARSYCDGLSLTLQVDRGGVSPVDEAIACDFTMVSDYRPGGLHLVTFRATSLSGTAFTRAQVRGIKIGSTLDGLAAGSRTMLRWASIAYRSDYGNFAMLRGRGMRDDVLKGDDAFLPTWSLSKEEEFDPRANDQTLRNDLLKHLNEFVEHYHHIIWWRMDAGRRFMLLDGYLAPDSGGRSVASVTENRLLSIVGNSLVLPVAPGFTLDPSVVAAAAQGKPIDLLEAYRPPIPFAPKRISMPTRGVHAEAIMSECDSCERTDNTRFWDWASEPTGDEPTEILPTSTASRRTTPPDTTPAPLPSPIVAIQNAPAAPEPTSVAALTALLGQKNLFKDVTGLEGNQANALAAFKGAMDTANFFGKMAAGGAKAAHANRQGERITQKLKDAERSGLISHDDASTVARRLFSVMNADVTGNDRQLPAEAPVQSSLKKFLDGPGKKKLSVTQGSGNQSQTVDASFDNGSGAPPEQQPAINVTLDGVPTINQVKSRGCWAAAVTMLKSYAQKQSLSIDQVLAAVGGPYPQLYADDVGLQPSQTAAFMTAFGLQDASVGTLTAEALAAQLQGRGPLWVVVDEDPSSAFAAHALVLTGIVGQGDSTNTDVIYNDPATGKQERETLAAFIEKSKQLASGLNSAFGGYAPTILSL